MQKIAIFASGNGSNAENIIKYFEKSPKIKIELIISSNSIAKVLEKAKKHNISTAIFTNLELNNGELLNFLKLKKINFIVLAGFLLKIPKQIIVAYPKQIINIHPSLLPLYGGKGMYGKNVHKKVLADKARETGITIHFINELYDDGAIIFQAKCSLDKNVKLKQIEKQVKVLEKKFFPIIIEKILNE
tara:strand:+ start:53 stop:616 length:564 start_codon:yes stop_codon:yes gene_type:complete